MKKPFHILILSAGSLLSQNILDTLERRSSPIKVTGINTSGDNARVFRCDQVYKAPLTESPEYFPFLIDVIEREQPDIILPGRDHDVLALAELISQKPELQKSIPVGSSEAVEIMNDKGLSFQFAQKFNLPFANSFLLDDTNITEAVNWAEACGFPILAKLRGGFGSLGIRILCNSFELKNLLNSGDTDELLLQQIIDLPSQHLQLAQQFSEEAAKGIPLFFHVPDENQFAGQTIIKPDGSIGEIFTSRSLMVIGRCEKAERWNDPVFVNTVCAYAEAMSSIGWRGTFNLQCRKKGNQYIGIEMNPRMSGSTSARGWLGYDEMREVIKSFIGYDIGSDTRYPENSDGIVYRSLTDYYVSKQQQLAFETNGYYKHEK